MKRPLTLVIVLMLFSGCARAKTVKQSVFALGTIVEITASDAQMSKGDIKAALQNAFAEIKRIENLFSRFNPQSDISQINARAALRPIKVSRETINLLEKAVYFSRLSDGAFDVTVFPAMQIWGLAEKKKDGIPDAGELTQVLDKIGYRHININQEEQTVFLEHPGVILDLGGIAKGYAVDQAAAVLRQSGVASALVNAGGDIYALGKSYQGDRWKIGLQHPRQKDTILTTLELEDRAVATSGDYFNFIEIDGKRYGHIIDPRTAHPCADLVASVTVSAGDCLSADALATAVFVLGAPAGLDLINRLPDTEAIVINYQGDGLEIAFSQGLIKQVKEESVANSALTLNIARP